MEKSIFFKSILTECILSKQVLFVLFLFVNVSLYSLGAFSLFNGRNRVDLDWYEIKSEYVRIVYNGGLYETALRAAAIADSTYNVLTKTFEIVPNREILIYLSDQDDITNGAALLDHYIFIWVDSNDFVKMFTGNQKWLEKVIPHEMVHWFVMYTLRDWLSMFLPISQLDFPMEMHEGYAMYFSGEPWGLNRGDRYLRTYAFSRNSGQSDASWIGNFMYASGFSFVKYLSEFYGEEKLVELLKYRKKDRLYKFEEAFKKVYDKPFTELWEEWSRYINTWYFGEAYLQKLTHTDIFSEELSINAVKPLDTNIHVFDFVAKGEQIVAAVKLSQNQGFMSLIHGTLNADSLAVDKFIIEDFSVIENAGRFVSGDISLNGRYVVFTRYTRHKHGRIAPLLTLYDTHTRKKYRLGEGSFPTVNDGGEVYYQRKVEGGNSISKLQITNHKSQIPSPIFVGGETKSTETEQINQFPTSMFIALTPDNQIVDLKLSPSGEYLAATIFDEERDFLVVIFDVSTEYFLSEQSETVSTEYILSQQNNYPEPIEILQLHFMPQETLWMDDKNLAILVENENTFKLELYLYDLEAEDFRFFDTPPYNIMPRILVENDEGLRAFGLNEINRSGSVIGVTNLPEREYFDNRVTEDILHYYNRWIYREPAHQIPDVMIPYQYLPETKYSAWKNIKYRMGFALPTTQGVVGTVVFSEPLGKHIFQAAGFFPLWHEDNDPYWIISYMNSVLKPSISVVAVNTNWIAGVHNDEIITNKLNLFTLEAWLPQDFRYKSFSSLNYLAGLSYYNFRLMDRSDDYEEWFEDDDFILANIGAWYSYNLPWRNSVYHPVREFRTDLTFDFADESLGMMRDYWQMKAFTDISYAPFLGVGKQEILKTIAIQNRTHYRLAGGDPLSQFLPGVDDSEFFYIGGQPLFSRLYLRGFNEMMWGKELFSTQTDLKIKLIDDLNITLNIGTPLIKASYLGGSLWYDYTRLSQRVMMDNSEFGVRNSELKNEHYNFEAMGYEIRSALEILGIPTLHRFGQAWDTNGKKLDFYYMLEIPILMF